MLGSVLPVWILWIITAISKELPLFGSVVPGLWHITQYCTSTRAPPCATDVPVGEVANDVWQLLQVAVFTISRL